MMFKKRWWCSSSDEKLSRRVSRVALREREREREREQATCHIKRLSAVFSIVSLSFLSFIVIASLSKIDKYTILLLTDSIHIWVCSLPKSGILDHFVSSLKNMVKIFMVSRLWIPTFVGMTVNGVFSPSIPAPYLSRNP